MSTTRSNCRSPATRVLGLAYRNTVLQYQQRYSVMPRPVFDLGKGRVKLWLRPEVIR
jgi:hypothetical protein